MKQATKTWNSAALPWPARRPTVRRGDGGLVLQRTFGDDFALLQRQIEDEAVLAVVGAPPASRAAAAEVEGPCAS